MFDFLVKRFFGSLVLILFITLVTFSVMKLDIRFPAVDFQVKAIGFKLDLPETHIQTGDPLAELKLNPSIPANVIEAESKRLGLDKPFFAQYFTWVTNILRGDLGYSQSNQKVIDLIKPALFNTLILNLFAIFFTWTIALPLGIYAAVNRNRFADKFFRILTSCFMSLPSFVLAIFGLLIALQTGLFPIGGLTSSYFDELSVFGQFVDLARHLMLPVIILVMVSLAGLQRQMRANILDVLREDYVQTARAKGLDETKVIYKHAARNAVNPLVTIFGYEFSALFAGAALVEMVLAYPGLGYLTLEAARKLDMNVVMANLLLGSVMLVLGNLLADIMLTKVDPRIKLDAS